MNKKEVGPSPTNSGKTSALLAINNITFSQHYVTKTTALPSASTNKNKKAIRSWSSITTGIPKIKRVAEKASNNYQCCTLTATAAATARDNGVLKNVVVNTYEGKIHLHNPAKEAAQY